MADHHQPTNEYIVELLDLIRAELRNLTEAQAGLTAQIDAIAEKID